MHDKFNITERTLESQIEICDKCILYIPRPSEYTALNSVLN